MSALRVAVYEPTRYGTHDCTHEQSSKALVERMVSGICRDHDVDLTLLTTGDEPVDADVAVFWSHRIKKVIDYQRAAYRSYLVMERGYLGDRFMWTSLLFNGLNGHGQAPHVNELSMNHPERLWRRWVEVKVMGNLQVQPLVTPLTHPEVLVLGQVPGDCATAGVNLPEWEQWVIDYLIGVMPWAEVRLRPHPNTTDGRSRSTTLAEDLAGAWLAVTYNSTSAVEALIAGRTSLICDMGSIAREASHRLVTPGFLSDGTVNDGPAVGYIRAPTSERDWWLQRLASKQWLASELESGEAWETVRRGAEKIGGMW